MLASIGEKHTRRTAFFQDYLWISPKWKFDVRMWKNGFYQPSHAHHQITRQSPPCPQAFVSLMQLFNLWPCGAIFLNIYRIVTVISPEILPHATFGDPIPRKKGIARLAPNYPLFLNIWSERLDSNQRLPAPKKSTSFIIITNT